MGAALRSSKGREMLERSSLSARTAICEPTVTPLAPAGCLKRYLSHKGRRA